MFKDSVLAYIYIFHFPSISSSVMHSSRKARHPETSQHSKISNNILCFVCISIFDKFTYVRMLFMMYRYTEDFEIYLKIIYLFDPEIYK